MDDDAPLLAHMLLDRTEQAVDRRVVLGDAPVRDRQPQDLEPAGAGARQELGDAVPLQLVVLHQAHQDADAAVDQRQEIGVEITYDCRLCPWRDGTIALVLEPLDLLARIVPLIPPPRFHMIRYHGVLSSHAKARAEVVPRPPPPRSAPRGQLRLALPGM